MRLAAFLTSCLVNRNRTRLRTLDQEREGEEGLGEDEPPPFSASSRKPSSPTQREYDNRKDDTARYTGAE
ncbi:hypothetical protein MTO96_024837 [Rhipicephalus appendiculatus]